MSFIKPVSLACLLVAVTACTTQKPVAGKASPPNNEDWYQVRTAENLYLFDDYSIYRNFLDTGKAPVLRDLGEKDKWGQSVVLALGPGEQDTPLDKVPAYQFYRVALPSAWPFYGEIRQNEVIYVFRRAGDMNDMNAIGEPTFRYTEIGGGPNGERVIYVLAKEEQLPAETVSHFKKNYSLQ